MTSQLKETKTLDQLKQETIKRFEDEVGNEDLKGNIFECKCCGKQKHRQSDATIKAKDTWIYKHLFDIAVEQITTAWDEAIKECMKTIK